ncbi:MAG: sialate O-acetylesterase, partial [Bacteroidaceae bacterium]|nr:sialate O-acetylesterase [Bacteroidaceae bacterium]
MKRLTFLLMTVMALTMTQAFAKKVKVACVGNSITYGAFIDNREKYHYPAQLQGYLGEEYEVRNFGLNGATLLLQGDYPYMKSPQYQQSLDFLPDIVIIKLGTNDTKPWNWEHKADFRKDYKTLIDSYRALSSKPRIILLTPLRCFLPDNDPGINSQRIAQEVRPMVEEMAYNEKLDIINMHNVVGDTWDAAVMPDRLHPSALGAGSMALKIAKHLKVKEETIESDHREPFYKKGASTFNFHGFQGFDFESDGVKCKVVEPHVVAEGKPWIWRARFWGHEPQTDIDLLERGYHVAYCDVADLFGSPEAVKRWNVFYRHMVKAGFSRKMALEGMSRGGLIIYNWAAKNPKKVACIY